MHSSLNYLSFEDKAIGTRAVFPNSARVVNGALGANRIRYLGSLLSGPRYSARKYESAAQVNDTVIRWKRAYVIFTDSAIYK